MCQQLAYGTNTKTENNKKLEIENALKRKKRKYTLE